MAVDIIQYIQYTSTSVLKTSVQVTAGSTARGVAEPKLTKWRQRDAPTRYDKNWLVHRQSELKTLGINQHE